MYENTTKAITEIINTVNGYVIIPLEMLERLEKAAATLDVVKTIVAHEQYANSTVVTIRHITGVRYEKTEEEDEE